MLNRIEYVTNNNKQRELNMRTDNNGVAKAWANSNVAQNHGNNYRTDGNDLYSYNLLIGFTTKNGHKVLLDYTASGGSFQSMTTSTKHVSSGRGYCTEIMRPSVVEGTDIISNRRRIK